MSTHDDARRRSHDLAWIPGLIVWRNDPRGADAPMDAPDEMVAARQLEARIAIRRSWSVYEVLPDETNIHAFACARALLEEWTTA